MLLRQVKKCVLYVEGKKKSSRKLLLCFGDGILDICFGEKEKQLGLMLASKPNFSFIMDFIEFSITVSVWWLRCKCVCNEGLASRALHDQREQLWQRR